MPLAEFGFLLPPDVRSEFGFQTGIAPVSPAAGATFSRKVPGDFFEIPVNVRCAFTTSAAVANRILILRAKDGDGNQIAKVAAFAVQAASLGSTYNWSLSLGSAYAVGTDTQMMPLFPFVMPSGWTLQLDVVNIQAADQLSQIGLVLQQYNTGVELESVRSVTPLAVDTLGLVASAPLGSPTPAAAALPGSSTPAADRAATPAATPAAAPALSTELGPGSSAGSGPGVSRL